MVRQMYWIAQALEVLSSVHVSGFPYQYFLIKEYHRMMLVVFTDRQQAGHQSELEVRVEPARTAW
jgi:hypothetical protein